MPVTLRFYVWEEPDAIIGQDIGCPDRGTLGVSLSFQLNANVLPRSCHKHLPYLPIV